MRNSVIAAVAVAVAVLLVAAVSADVGGGAVGAVAIGLVGGLAVLPLAIWILDKSRRPAVSLPRLLVTYAITVSGASISVLILDGSLLPTAAVMVLIGAIHSWMLGDLLRYPVDRKNRSDKVQDAGT